MALIRPSFVESLFTSFFGLDSDRMYYYNNVVRLARSIFRYMGAEEYEQELNDLIDKYIEKPLNTQWIPLMHAYYSPRFVFYKQAYTRVGDLIHGRDVTRFEMQLRLEKIKDYCYDKVTELSRYVRFTSQQVVLPQ